MYMFIVYSLAIFIISCGMGKLIIKKEGILKDISAPIGFIIFFAVLQLGYYPMQYSQVISTVVHIYTAIITVIFTLIVNLVTHFNLKKIYMIASLKSVD